MNATYVLRITLPDDYDGPILDAGSVMASALHILNSGEDEVPVQGVACERVDVAPVKETQTDGFLRERANFLREEHSIDELPRDPAYREGWADGLYQLLNVEADFNG